MGFFDKIKTKIKDKSNDSNNKTIENLTSNNSSYKNFKYLDNIVNSGKKEIILNHDICLDNAEESIYSQGVKINSNDLVIDGNGHTIDAKGKCRIFEINGKNIIFKNITFKNGFSNNGGAISNFGEIQLINSNFFNNNARESGGSIHNQQGHLKIISCDFSNSNALVGGSIYNIEGKIKISDSNFLNNAAEINGGCIFNFGELVLENIKVEKCTSKNGSGGAIFNEKGPLNINNCEFLKNDATNNGGVILTHDGATLSNSKFIDNTSIKEGGVINNQKGMLNISYCEFLKNNAQHSGGVLFSFSDANLKNSIFIKNSAIESGGAINCQNGTINILDCEFRDNSSNGGGAIFNYGNLYFKKSIFTKNSAQLTGGVVYNYGNIEFKESKFNNNSANAESNTIFNTNKIKVDDCIFSQNNGENNCILNQGSMEFIGNVFEDNNSTCIICNASEAILSVIGGSFIDNHSSKSAIANFSSSCSLNRITFNNNISDEEYSSDIYNESVLSLQDPKFKGNINSKSIFNKGHMDIRQFPRSDFSKKVLDKGTVKFLTFESENYQFNFSYLDESIKENHEIILENNIILEDYEIDFYEGGIELDKDNVHINGNGNYIDAKGRSSIFCVTGKNIILENIVFKNGFVFNGFSKHTTGGGAIRIVKDASVTLINCKFINNSSQDDGGAILNNGSLNSSDSYFEDNNSEYCGGVVYNRGYFKTKNDKYENNSSKLGGAIYNYGELILENPTLSNNESNLNQPIFNNENLISSNLTGNLENIIYNIGNINKEKSTSEKRTFKYLNDIINNSDVVELNQDIEFDYNVDNQFRLGVSINKQKLIIDGCGHTIDGKNSATLFNIMENCEVIMKNINLKNFHATTQSIIINHGDFQLENCHFDNNHALNETGLIENFHKIKFEKCIFSNNHSRNNYLITNENNLKILNSNIINNSSLNTILFNQKQSDAKIVDTCFMNNYCDINGTTLYNWGKLNLNHSKFIDNSSKGDSGAINNRRDGILNIVHCNFLKNNCFVNGGAISNFGIMKLDNSKFLENYAKISGGAIDNQIGSSTDINDCEFLSNGAHKNGGAIFNFGKLQIDNTNFMNNFADEEGGAINSQEGRLEFENCIFSGNNARYNDDILNYSHFKEVLNNPSIPMMDFGEFIIHIPQNNDLKVDVDSPAVKIWVDDVNKYFIHYVCSDDNDMSIDNIFDNLIKNGAIDVSTNNIKCLEIFANDGQKNYWLGYNDENLINTHHKVRFVAIQGLNYDLMMKMIQSIEFK